MESPRKVSRFNWLLFILAGFAMFGCQEKPPPTPKAPPAPKTQAPAPAPALAPPVQGAAPVPPSDDRITVFTAKQILTMNPAQPTATAVEVRQGRIYAVGSLDQMQSWWAADAFTLDRSFETKVILPGFVEAHSHLLMLGTFWRFPYLGYFDVPGPSGPVKGMKTQEEMLARLKAEDAKLQDPKAPLIGWGFDPLFTPGVSLEAKALDQVSTTRPIFVLQQSGHMGTGNSALLQAAGFNSATTLKGVVKDASGQPTGLLQELDVLKIVLQVIGPAIFDPRHNLKSSYDAGRLAQQGGATTAADWTFGEGDAQAEAFAYDAYRKATSDPGFPVRVMLGYDGVQLLSRSFSADAAVVHFQGLARNNTEKLMLNTVKFWVDGSPQGFTARVKWPGYYNGAPNGIFNMSEDQLFTAALPFWKNGIQVRVHIDGDEATDVVLNVLDRLLKAAPQWDHRFVIEHNPRSSQAQYFRMARLGAVVNLFASHLYYYGDIHERLIDGPDLSQRIFAAATAKRMGIPFSFHSDANVTPIQPLFYAWAAVNRLSATGKSLGNLETISVMDALEAITLGGAILLKRDDKIGSIETGKLADFTILEQNPLEVPKEKLKDIPIWGTVLGGRLFPREGAK